MFRKYIRTSNLEDSSSFSSFFINSISSSRPTHTRQGGRILSPRWLLLQARHDQFFQRQQQTLYAWYGQSFLPDDIFSLECSLFPSDFAVIIPTFIKINTKTNCLGDSYFLSTLDSDFRILNNQIFNLNLVVFWRHQSQAYPVKSFHWKFNTAGFILAGFYNINLDIIFFKSLHINSYSCSFFHLASFCKFHFI